MLPIISAEDRAKEFKGVKALILGKPGIGKTSLLWTLPEEKTLFVDLEAGDLAVEGCQVDTLRAETWKECQDLACFIGGANPSLRDDQQYSQAHYKYCLDKFGDPKVMDKYENIFIDSITVASRKCFQWARGEPEAFSDKTGKPNPLGAYGLLGQQMIGWLTHIQHIRNKNVFFVCVLDEKMDDFNRRIFVPQVEGVKTANEMLGIVDEVITMAEIREGEQEGYRAFITKTINSYGYPAKDRSGRLNPIEEPHLSKIVEKCKKPLANRFADIKTTIPFLEGDE